MHPGTCSYNTDTLQASTINLDWRAIGRVGLIRACIFTFDGIKSKEIAVCPAAEIVKVNLECLVVHSRVYHTIKHDV